MDFEALSETLRQIENSRVAELEIEWEEGNRFLRVQRAPAARAAAPPSVEALAQAEEEQAGPAYLRVEANLVGRFHQSEPPIVVGDAVKADEILGEVESMRLMNPVVAPASGRIAAVHVEDGQPVEYGQLLFEIEPE